MDVNSAINGYFEALLEYVARIVAPESILAQARGEVRMTPAQQKEATAIVQSRLQPGDLILTQTPAPLFGLFRDLGSSKYDHLVAVIDSERSLHISYPRAQLVPTILFVQRKKHPLVLRCCHLDDQAR